MFDHIFSNILDRRGTGEGKTTDAIIQLNKTVSEGGVVVYVMGSYKNLDENARRVASPNTLVFRGRPQPGMCVLYVEKQRYSKYIRPKFGCRLCLEQFGCRYKEQRDTVEHLAKSDEGFAVFTVPKNLKYVLKLVGKRSPLIIIDDVSLAQVVLPEEKVEKSTIITALPYLEPYPSLSTVSKMLLNQDEDPKSIIKHIRSIRKAYGEELDQVSIRLEDQYDSGIGLPDLNYLFELDNADKVVINDPVDAANVRIYSDLTKQLKKYQLRYLNATPSQADCEAMKWLGQYDELADPSEHRDKWHVLHLTGVKYTKQSLLDSKPLESKLRQIASSFEKQLTFINQPLLFMSKREANKERFYKFFSENYPDLSVEFVDFFSPQSYGTNKFRNSPFSVIVGAAIKNPSAFGHPCYDDLRRPEEEIQKEIEKEMARREKSADLGKKLYPLFVYPVPREIADSDYRNSTVQMIGRNLRDGINRDQVKIAIVITDIDLADDAGYIPENGAKVEQFDSIEKLIVRLEELVKGSLEPQVMDEIFRQVDVRLAQGETVGLDQARKAYAKITGVSERNIRKELSARYDLCQTVNHQNKSTTVLKKKPQTRPITPFGGVLADCLMYCLKNQQRNGLKIEKYHCPTNGFEIKAINVPKIKNERQFAKVLPIIYTIERNFVKPKNRPPLPNQRQ